MTQPLQHHAPRVLTIDGPSGAGKGTAALRVAQALGWSILDSGALYRLCALAALEASIPLDDRERLVHLARNLDVQFVPDHAAGCVQAWLGGHRVQGELRREETGRSASKVAAYPELREALLARQRDFATGQNLVADGRDMGTVVFPDACCKVFLDASAQERARRRAQQLKEQGLTVSLRELQDELEARDRADRERAVAPLKPADDAWVLDSSNLTIDEVVRLIHDRARECCGL